MKTLLCLKLEPLSTQKLVNCLFIVIAVVDVANVEHEPYYM